MPTPSSRIASVIAFIVRAADRLGWRGVTGITIGLGKRIGWCENRLVEPQIRGGTGRMRATVRVALAVAITAIMGAGCVRERDRFWPDGENGRLALSSPRVIAGDRERLVELIPTGDPGHPTAIERLSHSLRVGDRVTVGVTLPVDGEYTVGGGWVFHGRTYRGRHGVAGDLLDVTSSRPEVAAAGIDEHGRLELHALAAGEAVVTLEAVVAPGYDDLPEHSATFTDTVVFVVEE